MSTQCLAYSVVDAFTSTPFKGNPAAVVILDGNLLLLDSTLQNISAEFNLSDTAFITSIDAAKGRFGLRWFSPRREVAICGHATLASASVLFSERTILPESVTIIEFETEQSGVLTAKILPDGRIELEFPAGEVVPVENSLDKKIRKPLSRVFKDGMQPVVKFVGTGSKAPYRSYMVIELDPNYDLETAHITPDPFTDLFPQHRVIVVTQQGQDTLSFKSRVFCPIEGVPEDPVTGSAHSLLGPYWATQLQIGNEAETELIGRQVSKRSGEMGVIVDRQRGRCRLRGRTTLVARGEIYLPS